MTVLAIIGALCLWAALGYLFELVLQRFIEPQKRRPVLAWIEISVVYGPIGIGVRLWEAYESRRWRHK